MGNGMESIIMMNFGYEGSSKNQGMMAASTGQYGQYFPLEALN